MEEKETERLQDVHNQGSIFSAPLWLIVTIKCSANDRNSAIAPDLETVLHKNQYA